MRSLTEWLDRNGVDRRVSVPGWARTASAEFPFLAGGVKEADHSLI
jgi:hypothetical protein